MADKTVFCFTVTRAATPERIRALQNTVIQARDTAGYPFDWHVWESGCSDAGKDTLSALEASGQIDKIRWKGVNVGQHVAINEAIPTACAYDYWLRVDDDCKFLTKRWLAKMLEVADAFDDKCIVSPLVRGLRNPPEKSNIVTHCGYDVEIFKDVVGGVCRLHPMAHFETYVSDVRRPAGYGDSFSVGKFCKEHGLAMVCARSVRVKHDTQEHEDTDPQHFSQVLVHQHVPYIPC